VRRFKPLPDAEGLNLVGDLSAPAGHEIIANDVVCDGWFVRRSGIISRGDANLLQSAHFYVKPTTHTSDFGCLCKSTCSLPDMAQITDKPGLKGENPFAWRSRQNVGP